jgi:hypothetical protein
MPRITKGGKHIFGWSLVGTHGRIRIPPEAYEEYRLFIADKVILFSGSKTTGGICVTTKALVQQSKLSDILVNNPGLAEYRIKEGQFIRYKGRLCCWVSLKKGGILELSDATLAYFKIKHGDHLLVIRGSNIGPAMGVRGPIIDEAKNHTEIEVFK